MNGSAPRVGRQNPRENLSLGALFIALVSGKDDVRDVAVSFCESVMEQKKVAKRNREREPSQKQKRAADAVSNVAANRECGRPSPLPPV